METKDSPATIIFDDQPRTVTKALADERSLWMETSEMSAATGWELKPQGACRGDTCVPLSGGRQSDFIAERGGARYFNFTALADMLGKPWACDLKYRVWYFGAEAAARSAALVSLKAPDFTLPDLEGRTHSLHDHLGKKIFLVSWASW